MLAVLFAPTSPLALSVVPWTDSVFLTLYILTLGALAVFGWHRLYLVYLYFRHRPPELYQVSPRHFPRITIQLPIYNERYVAERLVRSVCRLKYPKDRLEIQVLDDSTDDTSAILSRATNMFAAQGLDIRHIRRTHRQGFKAGALANGLESAKGDLIAIFDADFVPSADTLERMVIHFGDPEIGMVQARWGHLNRDYSLLTRLQAMLLDGHFILESAARCRGGLFLNFNGTAGIWRRSAIVEAGGWQHDTLTEDLDLSYRAQLVGWKLVLLEDVVVPAELPVEINSFKTQQFRWAKGSIQTARKILPRLFRADLPLRIKVESAFHLLGHLSHPLIVALTILTLPALLVRYQGGWQWAPIDLPLFLSATSSVGLFYLISQKLAGAPLAATLGRIPLLMGLGVGLSVTNARAVLEGLRGVPSAFVRTPKFKIETGSDRWKHKNYRHGVSNMSWLEVSFGIYFLGMVALCVAWQAYPPVPLCLLFGGGYLSSGILSMLQGERPVRVWRKRNIRWLRP